MAFCHNCGANVGDSLFCGNCGTKIPCNEKPDRNTVSQSMEAESHEKEPRFAATPVAPIKIDKKEPEKKEIPYHNEPKHYDAPEPQKYNEPKTEIKNVPLQDGDRVYRHDPKNIYSNSNNYEAYQYGKEVTKPNNYEGLNTGLEDVPLQNGDQTYRRDSGDIYSNSSSYEPYRYDEDEEPNNKHSDVYENRKNKAHAKKKITPVQRRKKVATVIVLIIFAVAAIGSAVAVGLYINPKADLLVIANATAKTVFQSGSLNYNIDEVYYEDGLDGDAFMGDNYNGCLFWGDDVKDSYFYVYSGDEEGYFNTIKYENGSWSESYNGEKYQALPYEYFYMSNIVPEKVFESTTIDEKGFESLLDKAVIPLVNAEFSGYWESSIDSLTGEQTVKILTDMLSDKYFNETAVKINSKEKTEDGTQYSLTVDLNTLISSCWNYLKDSDIYRIMLDNSENSEEFDREMTEFFSEFDYFDYLPYDRYYIDLIINNDGYISNLTFNAEEDYHHSVMQYRVEVYNFGIAEKQK